MNITVLYGDAVYSGRLLRKARWDLLPFFLLTKLIHWRCKQQVIGKHW